jgi:hypothetical protein
VSVHDAHAFLQVSFDGGRFGHGLGLVFEVAVGSDVDVAMFGGGTWSRASWQMHTPSPGVWGLT